MARSYLVEDDGFGLQLGLFDDGVQVGGALIDLEPLGVDEAMRVALVMAAAFVQAQGDGAAHAP